MKKILKLIIFILFIIFVLNIIRNYIIINKIDNKQQELAKSNNYLIIVEKINDKLEKITIESYYKDGKEIEITKNNGEIMTIGPSVIHIQLYFADSSIWDKILYSATSFIYYDKIEDEKCYVINTLVSKEYFSKETGAILKNMNDIKYKYRFNELTDELIESMI